MAFANLSLAAAIWKNLGLRHVLLPDGLTREAFLAKAGPQAARPARDAPKARAAPPRPAPRNGDIPANAGQAAPPGQNRLGRDQWPQIWLQRFSATKPGLIAWTYRQLGEDLLKGGKNAPANEPEEARAARKARSGLLGRVLKDLAHPGGTHTFWPAALPEKGDVFTVNPPVFWSALWELGCRALVIMGPDAAEPLLQMKNPRPLSQFWRNGQTIWILKDIGELLESPRAYKAAITFLRNASRTVFPQLR